MQGRSGSQLARNLAAPEASRSSAYAALFPSPSIVATRYREVFRLAIYWGSGSGDRESGVGERWAGVGDRESGVGERWAGVGERESVGGEFHSKYSMMPIFRLL